MIVECARAQDQSSVNGIMLFSAVHERTTRTSHHSCCDPSGYRSYLESKSVLAKAQPLPIRPAAKFDLLNRFKPMLA